MLLIFRALCGFKCEQPKYIRWGIGVTIILLFCYGGILWAQDNWWQVPGPVPEPPPVGPPVIEGRPSGKPPSSPSVSDSSRPVSTQRPSASEAAQGSPSSEDFLRRIFRVPALPIISPHEQEEAESLLRPGAGTPFFGRPSKPAALSEAEWTNFTAAQETVDKLSRSPKPLGQKDIALLQQASVQQTAIWAKAVASGTLTLKQRRQLRMKLPTISAPMGQKTPVTLPAPSEAWLSAPPEWDPNHTPITNPLGPWLSEQLASTAIGGAEIGLDNIGEAVAERLLGEDNAYGDAVAVARLALALKQEGGATALAETANWLISWTKMPQADLALWGGRFGASLTFAALDKFLTDAFAAVGVSFDPEKAWIQLREEANLWQQAVLDFVGAPGK